jgi:hypothetical protein
VELLLWGSLFVLAVLLFYICLKVKKFSEHHVVHTAPPQPQLQQINVNLKPLQDAIEGLPSKVLQSITSCTNTHKGALGELIGYVQLHAAYDRIIPLGNIVDFICIKFKTAEAEGYIDFVDVKTGNKSRLSNDQRELQRLIQEKRINFIKLKVETTSNDDSDRAA